MPALQELALSGRDAVLDLEENACCSPVVLELAAVIGSKMPVGQAAAVLEHLTA